MGVPEPPSFDADDETIRSNHYEWADIDLVISLSALRHVYRRDRPITSCVYRGLLSKIFSSYISRAWVDLGVDEGSVDLLFRVGLLHVSFYVLDMGTVREVLDDLTDEWDWVSVLRLLRSEDGRDGDDFVLVDCGDLADRDRGRSEYCPDRTELYLLGNIFAEMLVLRAVHTEVWSASDDTLDRLWMNSFQ